MSNNNNPSGLDKYGYDLTQAARRGELDPVIGREKQTRELMEVMCRRRKNNAVLLGEPGVGKTAVAEGLAQRIASGNVPTRLVNKRIVTIDLSLMIAGTRYRGEFEARLRRVIDDAREDRSVILVIDEMHTLIGAGSAEGAMDAANILKPALARGELQCIGATTSDEYKKYIERDAALQRRFQPIIVPEPTVEETVQILKGLRNAYELYHLVTLEDEALLAAAQLSSQYIADRFLPDKAIDLMDQSGARANLGASAQSPMAQRVELQRESLRVVELLKAQALRLGEINAIEPLHQLEKAWYTQLLRYQYVRKQIDPHENERLAKDLEERNMTLDAYKEKLYKDVYGEIKREATLRIMKEFRTLFLTESEHYLGIFEAARIRLHTQSHGILKQLGYGYNPNFQNYNPEVEYLVEFDNLDLQTFSHAKELLHAQGLELEQALDDQLHDADIITSWPSAYFRASISKEEDEEVTEVQLDRAILEIFQIIYRTRDPLRLGLDFLERRTVRALVYQLVENMYPKKTAAYVDSVERKISILIHKQLMSVNAKNIQGAVTLGFAESMKNPTKFPDRDLVPIIQEFAEAQYKKLKRREGHPVLEARKAYEAESLEEITKELAGLGIKSKSRLRKDKASQKDEASQKTRRDMEDFFAQADLLEDEALEEEETPQKDGLFPKFFNINLDLPFNFGKKKNKKKKKNRLREEADVDFLINRPSITLKDMAERYVEYVLTFKESPVEDVPGALLSFNPISEKDFFFNKNSITDIRRSLMAGEVSREEMQDRLQRHYNLVYEAATKHYLSASKYDVEEGRKHEFSDDLMDLHVEEEAMGEQLRAINEKLRVIIGPIVKPRKKKILKEDLSPDPSREEVKKIHDPLLTRDFLEYLREKLGTSVSESVFDRICVELGNPTDLLKTQNVMADDPEDLAKLIQEKEAAIQYGKPHIRRNEIAQLIADFTGIPVMDVSKDEAIKLQNLENILHERVIGQQEAIYAVSSAVRRARVGISNPNRPIASFVFCGPTGVGKTELTKALAAHMFGSEDSVIRLDMSEYMEKHTISQMIGSPPGYIGFGEGGQLTEKVRRRPYSVVLFDEIEKAHPDILDLLLQLLDDGRLTDAQGRVINFKNTIVILTSNIGSHIVQAHIEANPINEEDETLPKPKDSLQTDRPSNKTGLSEKKKDPLIFQSKVGLKDRIFRAEDLGLDKEESFIEPESKNSGVVEKDKKEEESYSNLRSKVLEEFRQSFRPEFLNRLDELIVFRQLTKKEVRQIADIMVNQLSKRIAKQGQTLSVTEKAKDKLLDEGYDPIFGARPMRRAITKLIENGISEKLLAVQIEEGDAIFVDVDPKGDFQFVLTKKADQDAKNEKDKAAKKEQVQPKPISETVNMKVEESVKVDADTTKPRVVVDA